MTETRDPRHIKFSRPDRYWEVWEDPRFGGEAGLLEFVYRGVNLTRLLAAALTVQVMRDRGILVVIVETAGSTHTLRYASALAFVELYKAEVQPAMIDGPPPGVAAAEVDRKD